MAVVIRLARFGRTKRPRYRITVADSRKWVRGRFLDIIGFYNPAPQGKDVPLKVDLTKAQEWVAKGAQPTDRVKYLLHLAEKSSQPEVATD